jgi:hypothetical protein
MSRCQQSNDRLILADGALDDIKTDFFDQLLKALMMHHPVIRTNVIGYSANGTNDHSGQQPNFYNLKLAIFYP